MSDLWSHNCDKPALPSVFITADVLVVSLRIVDFTHKIVIFSGSSDPIASLGVNYSCACVRSSVTLEKHQRYLHGNLLRQYLWRFIPAFILSKLDRFFFQVL